MAGNYGIPFIGTAPSANRTRAIQLDTASVYGSIIPIGVGHRVVTGVPIWAGPFTNDLDGTEWQSGLKPNDHIVVSFAVAFGYPLAPPDERVPIGFSRLWAGNSLVFDNSNDEVIAKWPDVNFTIYSGFEDQLPCDLIVADKGDLTPAFRGLIYIVFRNFPVGKVAQPPLQLPTIRAELVENSVFANTVTPFTMLDALDMPRGLGGIVDWKANRFWNWSNIEGSDPHLHEYDMNTMQEVARKTVNIGAHGWVGSDWFMIYDENSHIAHSMVDGIANSTPIAAFNLNAGTLAGVFGVASTDLSSDGDGLQFSETGCLVRSIDANGTDISGLILGGLFNDMSLLSLGRTGSFNGYNYRGTTVQSGSPRGFLNFPLVGSKFLPEQWELDTQGQDFTAFVGIDDGLYAITGGSRGGSMEIIDQFLIKSFPGFSVNLIIYDGSTGCFVILLQDGSFNMYAARFNCTISSILGVGTYHGFLPILFDGNTTLPFIPLSYWPFQSAGSCDPQWFVGPIPAMGFGGNCNMAAMFSNTNLGTFGYQSGVQWHILNLATGAVRSIADGVSPDNLNNDWFWDSSRKLSVVNLAPTLTPDAPAIIRYERLDGDQPGFELGDTLRWLALRAGYQASEIYVDPTLTDPVLGVLIGEDFSAGPLFTTIGAVYDFQPFESEGVIKFIRAPRGTDVNVTFELNRDDLSPISEGDADANEVLTTAYEEESGQFASVSVTYINPAMEYSYSTQAYSAQNTISDNAGSMGIEDFKIPYVMTTEEAYARAGRIALAFNDLSVTQTFRLVWKYTRLEPTDVLGITIDAYRYIVRITEIVYNGDFSLSLTGRNYAYRDDLTIPSDGDLGPLPQLVPTVSDSLPVVLDIPLLLGNYNSERAVTYAAVMSYGQTAWAGATFERKAPDGDYLQLFHSAHQLNMAIAQSALPTCGDFPFATDTTTQLTLNLRTMLTSAFDTTDDDGLLDGLNAILIGASGRWEFVYFRDVTIVRPGVVTISQLIRGQRGTEYNTDNHEAGDTVYLIRSVAADFNYVIMPMLFDADLIGTTYRYRAEGDIMSTPAVAVSDAIVGNSFKPWAPWGWHAALSGSDVVLTWQRRTRVSGELEDGTGTVPLDEAAELYDLEILSGSTIVRTVSSLAAPTFTYTAAMQAADGFTAPVASVTVCVYQISAIVGRGFTHERTVDVE